MIESNKVTVTLNIKIQVGTKSREIEIGLATEDYYSLEGDIELGLDKIAKHLPVKIQLDE